MKSARVTEVAESGDSPGNSSKYLSANSLNAFGGMELSKNARGRLPALVGRRREARAGPTLPPAQDFFRQNMTLGDTG
jgi:hypothetical protein